MNGLENILHNKKIIAVVIRKYIEVKNGVNFFTKPNEPLQFAIHNHIIKKATNIHHNKVINPFKQSEKYKYIYITRGKAKIILSTKNKKTVKNIELNKGDSIIIKDICHQVLFSNKSGAIEIKQGPFTND